ncbi:hypothetical protein PSHT_14965 [Puccinia striiformis]|uniref:Uncharacterized protein n=2 Tax=Puccinia striiformis TaxID=27350 RepID=A0A2S4URS3_9BASI|nr:hypothetical protein PSHT_14965 [Puccinia striiformis]POV99998.1 hypothetical protein PSTT_13413 [Puccinia striiformis]
MVSTLLALLQEGFQPDKSSSFAKRMHQ